jgi:hypothetical protein
MRWWWKSSLVATSGVGGVLLKLEHSTASKDSSSVPQSADSLRLTFDANITVQMLVRSPAGSGSINSDHLSYHGRSE